MVVSAFRREQADPSIRQGLADYVFLRAIMLVNNSREDSDGVPPAGLGPGIPSTLVLRRGSEHLPPFLILGPGPTIQPQWESIGGR